MDDYIYEEINVGGQRRNVSLGLYMKSRLHSSKRVEVYDSDAFGRCLYLDGALQTTERDEYIYHETLVHPSLLRVTPENVLIIGGGDGGTLREVLKHKTRGLKRVVMVEINEEVVEVSKKFLPSFQLEASLKDPIVELVIGDGAKYLENICAPMFDAIIIDCSDPSPESNILYSREFFESCVKPSLKPDGIIAIQAGNVFIKEPFVRALRYELSKLWKVADYRYAPIPSYPSGGIGFYYATNNASRASYYGLESLDTKYLTRGNIQAGIEIYPKSFTNNKRFSALRLYKENFDWLKNLETFWWSNIYKFLLLEDEPLDEQYTLMSLKQNYRKGVVTKHSLTLMTLDRTKLVEESMQNIITMKELDIECKLPVNGITIDSNGFFDFHFIGKLHELWEYAPTFFKSKPEICFDEARLTYHFDRDNRLLGLSVTFSDLSRDYVKTHNGPEEIIKIRTNQKGRTYISPLVEERIDNLDKVGILLEKVRWNGGGDFDLHFKVGDKSP